MQIKTQCDLLRQSLQQDKNFEFYQLKNLTIQLVHRAQKRMLDSLPYLRKELEKVLESNKLKEESKIQKYQKKMLQLLIRQKTTILQNDQLTKQLQLLGKKFQQVLRSFQQAQRSCKTLSLAFKEKQQQNYKLKSQIEKLSETIENLDIQNKMNQMGRMNQQEKYAQLMEQYQLLHKEKSNLQGQLVDRNQEIQSLKQVCEQSKQQYEKIISDSQERSIKALMQKDNQVKFIQLKLSQAVSQLQQKNELISHSQQSQLKQQQKLTQLSSSQTLLKQKLTQTESYLTESLSKCNQLTKQLHLTKLKNKQYQQSLYSTQIQQGEQSLEFTKIDKENKKLKKDIALMEEKIAQIQEEKCLLEEKNQQLNKNYKNVRKQLEKVKDSLSEASENQTGIKSKIEKLQQTIKQYKQLLQQQQQHQTSSLSKITHLQQQSQAYRNQSITAKYNLEEMKKKYDLIFQARNIAQQKLVLEKEQHSRSLSVMIKQKDLCYRQNYKLLQLLELKDKTIEKIYGGLKNVEELQKELNLQVLSKDNFVRRVVDDILSKDITGHKERVKLIDQHLQKVNNKV